MTTAGELTEAQAAMMVGGGRNREEYAEPPRGIDDVLDRVPGYCGPATRSEPGRKYGLPLMPEGGPVIDRWTERTRRVVKKHIGALIKELARTPHDWRATVTMHQGVMDTTQWPDGATRRYTKNPRTGKDELLGVLVDGAPPPMMASTFAEDGRLLVIIEVGDWDLRRTVDEIVDGRVLSALRESVLEVAPLETGMLKPRMRGLGRRSA